MRIKLDAVLAFDGEHELEVAEGVPGFGGFGVQLWGDLFRGNLEGVCEDVTKGLRVLAASS